MIGLESLSPKKGSTHRKKRVGTGRGSGHGEHSTRGLNGQSSRSGNGPKESKEGGQMPLFRRIPKSGFSNRSFETYCESVNLSVIAGKFDKGAEVTPELMREKGLITSTRRVKVLGGGEISQPLKISAHVFSKSAKEKIEKAGGSATVISGKKN